MFKGGISCIPNDQNLSDIPTHLGLHKNFQVEHVIYAIFVSVHFIHPDITSFVVDDWSSHKILTQVSENMHSVEFFKIFPLILRFHIVSPLHIIIKLFPCALVAKV